MDKPLQKTETKDLEQKRPSDMQLMNPFSPFWPFVSFRYSSQLMYFDGEKTHIKAQEKKFENGRLHTQEFEGTLDKNIYEGMIEEMQRAFFKQLELFFKPFSLFLPGADKKRD